MTKYEYMIIEADSMRKQELDSYGNEGWELLFVIKNISPFRKDARDIYSYHFKKEII